VKTTLELPDELMRAIKIQAVRENRKLKDKVAELLRSGLSREPRAAAGRRRRVRLPLVRCAHRAGRGEITPERAAEILLADEAVASRGPVR
jgi:plasmid stability protein